MFAIALLAFARPELQMKLLKAVKLLGCTVLLNQRVRSDQVVDIELALIFPFFVIVIVIAFLLITVELAVFVVFSFH